MSQPMDEDYVDESERDSPPPRRRRSSISSDDGKAKEAQNQRRLRRASQWRTSKNFEQHMSTLDKLWRSHQKIPTLRGLMRVARIGYPKAQELLKAFRERHNLSEEDLRRHQGRGRGTKGSWVVNDANYNAAMTFDSNMNVLSRHSIHPTMNPTMSNLGSMAGYGPMNTGTISGTLGQMGMNTQPAQYMGQISTPRSADDEIKERINAAIESAHPYIGSGEKARAARLLQDTSMGFTQVAYTVPKTKAQVAGFHRFVASLFLDSSDCENAYHHIESGLQLFHQIGDKFHNEYTWDLYKMGAMILKGNKQSEDARRMFKFAQGVAERLWGKLNARYLEMLEEVAVLSVALFEWDNAKQAITELSQLYRQTAGLQSLHTLNAMAYQACIHYACQEDDVGAALRDQVLELARQNYDQTVAQWQYHLYFAAHAQMLDNKEIDCSHFLDFCLNWQGKPDEVVDREKKEGLRLLVGKHVLQLEGLGEMDRALHYLDQLLKLDQTMGGENIMYLQTLLHRAQLYKHIGRTSEAFADFRFVIDAKDCSATLQRDAMQEIQEMMKNQEANQPSTFPVFGPNGSPRLDMNNMPGTFNQPMANGTTPPPPQGPPHPQPQGPPHPTPQTLPPHLPPQPAQPTHPVPNSLPPKTSPPIGLPQSQPQMPPHPIPQPRPQPQTFPPANMSVDFGGIPSISNLPDPNKQNQPPKMP